MELAFAFLADDALIEQGFFTVPRGGGRERLTVGAFPYRHPKLVLVYRLRLNQDERTRNHQLRVDLVDPDGCTGYLSHPAQFRTWITQVASTGAPSTKKSRLKPWQRQQWCIGTLDGEYLAKLEDILDLYAQPSNPTMPRICIDERPCQLLDDVVAPLPPASGKVAKRDYEYVRKGTACVLLAYNLETGQRYTEVRERRTKADYAAFMAAAIACLCPTARRVRVVQDNLNTHTAGAFYHVFDAPTAWQWVQRLEMHYTPKHGSWLNMAEIEFSALVRQCLDRRIGSMERLTHEVAAWEADRNTRKVTIHWSFTVQDARTTLHRHYDQVNATN